MRNKGKLILWVVFIVVIIVVITMIVTTFGSKNEASGIQNITNTAMEPVIEGTYNTSMSIKNFFQRLFALRQVDKDYIELKTRVMELEIANQFMKDLELENQRLIDLLGYTDNNPEYKYISAKVIAKDPGSWFYEFTINRGEDDGVRVDMAVVNRYGLIGRVIQTTATTAKVMTIIDTRSAAAGVVERSRDQGMVKGAVDPESQTPICYLDHLPNDADLIPGDVVLSSSLGGIFPKGILVGEIQEVILVSSKVSYAILMPYVDFGHIEEVLIISGETSPEELAAILAEKEADKTEQQETTDETTDETTPDTTDDTADGEGGG